MPWGTSRDPPRPRCHERTERHIQAKLFHEAVGVTGIALTKLDGTAKGGIIVGITEELNLPLRYIGVGEGIDDLREFNASDFVRALF